MASNVNFNHTVLCLVCNRITQGSPVSVHSGLARRNGSIHDQISEIVGNQNIAEACEASEVVCPLCLKLLLSINNIEFELKNLKLEFLGIFHLGVESRTSDTGKCVGSSKLEYEEPSKSEADIEANKKEKNLSTCNERRGDFKISLLKTDKSSLHSPNTVVDGIKESFPLEHSSFCEKDPLCLAENVDDSLSQTTTCDLSQLSQQNDVELLQKELTRALHLVKESLKKHEVNSQVSDKPKDENDVKLTESTHENGDFNLLPSSNHEGDYKSLEGNVSFDFDNFETRLCSVDAALEGPSKGTSSRIVKIPRKGTLKATDKKPAKRKKLSKKEGKDVSSVEEDSCGDLDLEEDWDLEEDVHHDCKLDENKRKSCELCRDKVCKICGQVFSSATDLTDHRMRIHGDIYKYVCGKCPNVCYRHKAKLTQHFKLRHKVLVHQCPGCDVEETSQNSLDQHIINKHPESRFFECKICCKAFRTYRYLHCVHIKRCHIGLPVKYFCDKCQKGFVDKSSLDNHKYTHSDVKNFVCEFCGALFHTPYSLKVHTNTHTQEKKYTCPTCGMSFLRLCNLIGHKKRAHRSRDKRYVCEICGTLVHTNKDLITHQIVCHKGEKPFTCDNCGKNFANKRNLKEHFLIQHLQERPYKCHCGKAYLNTSRLRYHYKAVHKMEPSQQLTLSNSMLEENTKTVMEDNLEENMVVITVKECNASALYSMQAAPPHSHEVLISGGDHVSQVENNSLSETLTNSQGVELPLLHSPFGTIGTTPILFTSLNANPAGSMHHTQEVMPQEITSSKLDPSLAQLTDGIQSAFPYHPESTSAIADAEDQDPLKVESQESQTATPLTAELLELPNMHTNNPNSVPVTYITAWPT